MTEDELTTLHDKSSYHRKEMERVGKYACFYCKKRRTLDPTAQEWIDREQTAVCKCGVDACLPDDGTITDEMLDAMHHYWFEL